MIATAESLGDVFYELNYLHPMRWIAAEYEGIRKIYLNYHALINNMIMLSDNNDFSKDVQFRAKSYYKP